MVGSSHRAQAGILWSTRHAGYVLQTKPHFVFGPQTIDRASRGQQEFWQSKKRVTARKLRRTVMSGIVWRALFASLIGFTLAPTTPVSAQTKVTMYLDFLVNGYH